MFEPKKIIFDIKPYANRNITCNCKLANCHYEDFLMQCPIIKICIQRHLVKNRNYELSKNGVPYINISPAQHDDYYLFMDDATKTELMKLHVQDIRKSVKQCPFNIKQTRTR